MASAAVPARLREIASQLNTHSCAGLGDVFSEYGAQVQANAHLHSGARASHMASIHELRMLPGDRLDEGLEDAHTLMQPPPKMSREARFSAPSGFAGGSGTSGYGTPLERAPSFLTMLRAQQDMDCSHEALEALFC